jgi:hypothetical protein
LKIILGFVMSGVVFLWLIIEVSWKQHILSFRVQPERRWIVKILKLKYMSNTWKIWIQYTTLRVNARFLGN